MGELRLENERTKMKLENLEKRNPEVETGGQSGVSPASNTKKDATGGAKSAKAKSGADKDSEEAAENQESTDQTIAAQSKTITSLRSQTDQMKRHVIQVCPSVPIFAS